MAIRTSGKPVARVTNDDVRPARGSTSRTHDGACGNREPHAHEADQAGFQGDCAHAILDAGDDLRVERERREDRRGVAAVHERGLEMLHHTGDDDALAVADGIDVDRDGVVESAVVEMARAPRRGGSTGERCRWRAEHAHAARGEVRREAQRRVSSDLHDHACGSVAIVDCEHSFERHGLDVDVIGDARGDRRRLDARVDEDRLEAELARREERLARAHGELRAQPDASSGRRRARGPACSRAARTRA